MSTKIYNGLLIDFPGSFSDLRTELIRLAKEEIKPVAELEFTKMFAQAVFSQIDKNAWSNLNIVSQGPKLLILQLMLGQLSMTRSITTAGLISCLIWSYI